jgi:hypothetical protein
MSAFASVDVGKKSGMYTRIVTVCAPVLCALFACGGGYPEPRNQLSASEAAVRAAEVAGAQNSPQSALHLKRAREQVDSGKGLIQEGENERAEWVLRRAQADADLALTIANEEGQRKRAAQAKEELEQLKETVEKPVEKPAETPKP